VIGLTNRYQCVGEDDVWLLTEALLLQSVCTRFASERERGNESSNVLGSQSESVRDVADWWKPFHVRVCGNDAKFGEVQPHFVVCRDDDILS